MNTAEQLNSHASLLDLITDLVESTDAIPDAASIMITGVQLDSRLLCEGDLFLACFGRNHDARDYIDKAIDVGVAAILADADDNWEGVQVVGNVPVVAITCRRKLVKSPHVSILAPVKNSR